MTNTMFRFIMFLAIHFGGLAIGVVFTGKGVPSDWYLGLVKAPWTPPGWTFGFAWSTIMFCFSIYLTYLWPLIQNKKRLIWLVLAQWILNVSWNPMFFYYQSIGGGMLVITGLTLLIGFLLMHYRNDLKLKTLLLFPYFIWLLIATSLNGYIFLNN